MQEFLGRVNLICSRLTLANGPFGACKSKLPQESLQSLYASCIESACDASTLDEACIFVKHLAHECVNAGVNVTWTTDSDLAAYCARDMSCPSGLVYTDCLNVCARRCSDGSSSTPCVQVHFLRNFKPITLPF